MFQTVSDTKRVLQMHLKHLILKQIDHMRLAFLIVPFIVSKPYENNHSPNLK